MEGVKPYRTKEFAHRAGVTVRTLHHYDRLDLLKPSGRTPAGYRVYTDRDLVRLEQIVALKFIGFSLKEIRDVLNRDGDLLGALRTQRAIMAEKRGHIDRAIEAITEAEHAFGKGEQKGFDALTRIIEVIGMQQNMEWTNKYYSPEAKEKLAERRAADPGCAQRGQEKWAVLLAEVDKAMVEGVDPASDRAQDLAKRWQELIHDFTQGDPEIAKGLKALYSDKQNWPNTFRQPFKNEAAEFICKAQAAKK